MRFFLCSLLLFVAYSCVNTKKKRHQLIDFAPIDSEVILKSSNLESLKSAVANSTFLNSLSEAKSYKDFKSALHPIAALNIDSEVLICLSKVEQDSLKYTVITKFSETLVQPDSLKNYIEEHLKYKSYNITKSTLEDHVFFSTIIDSTFIISSSKETVVAIVNEEHQNQYFKKLYSVSGDNETLSVLAQTKSSLAPSFFIEKTLKPSKLCDFLTLDTEISQADILINGIATSLDTSKKVIDVFKNTVPQENQIQHITPGNSDGYLSFTFDDFKVFNENILKFRDKDSIAKNNALFNSIIEVGVIYEDKNHAIILHSIDPIATQDALLDEQNTIDSYRDITIFEFSKSGIFQETFNPLIDDISVSKYCILDNYFVFTDSMEQLQNVIANYQNKTTFGYRTYFKELSEKLSSESSLIFVAKPRLLEHVVDRNLGGNSNINLEAYNLFAMQFVYDADFAHVHGGLIKGQKQRVQHSVSESFALKLDADILNNPQFVTNHITKEKEVVVQDINNNLYLISNKGKVIWKKRLNGAILGDISQIDMYKNGRLQLAFSTKNRVYVIDRKGRDVAPFPLKFNDDITQPLSVFDYDKNKQYRLLVTQGKNILMYDARGKSVPGFTFKSASNDIISQPKHFRIGSKDYLVFKTKGKLYILDRTGRTRVSPKSKNTFSTEPVFLFQDKFTTTTEDGQLISLDTRGNVAKVNLNLSAQHNLETTSKTQVTFHDNKLSIKSRTLELDYGNYTRPGIFYINDKIYVTITDLQAKKIYLYDSQGKSIPNFPVYGNSAIQLDHADSDKNLEFVTKGGTNTIIIYQIN